MESPDVQRYPLQLEWVINQVRGDRPLPAAAVHGGFVRPSVRAGGPVGTVDAARQTLQRGAGSAGCDAGDLHSFMEAGRE